MKRTHIFLKTLETVSKLLNSFLKTLETVLQKINNFLTTLETVIPKSNIFLKTLETVIRNRPQEIQRVTGAAVHLANIATSDEKASSLTRSRSFASPARTHARHEHETKPKPISRLGSAKAYFPSTSDIRIYVLVPLGERILGF